MKYIIYFSHQITVHYYRYPKSDGHICITTTTPFFINLLIANSLKCQVKNICLCKFLKVALANGESDQISCKYYNKSGHFPVGLRMKNVTAAQYLTGALTLKAMGQVATKRSRNTITTHTHAYTKEHQTHLKEQSLMPYYKLNIIHL